MRIVHRPARAAGGTAWRTFWRWLRTGLALPLVVLVPAVAITGQDTYAELIVLIGAVLLVLALVGCHR